MTKAGDKIVVECGGETLVGCVTSLIEDEGFVAQIGDLYYPFIYIDGTPYPLLRDEKGEYLSPEELVECVGATQFMEN